MNFRQKTDESLLCASGHSQSTFNIALPFCTTRVISTCSLAVCAIPNPLSLSVILVQQCYL